MNLSILCLVFLCCFRAYAQEYDPEAVLTQAEQMPFFAGCEHLRDDNPQRRACSDKAILDYISAKLIYPDSAIAQGVSGVVIISFIVDEWGEIQHPHIDRDIGGDCGIAAIKVIKSMPRWEPGYHKNKPVKVKMTLPIRFSFKSKTGDEGEQYSIHWANLESKTITKTMLVNALESPLLVRDAYGNKMQVTGLMFTAEKGKKSNSAACSGGEPDKNLRKIVEKTESTWDFTVKATISYGENELTVTRTYTIQ